MTFDFSFSNPWFFLLLPIAILPFWSISSKFARYSSLNALPSDIVSSLLFFLIKLISFSVIALLILSLSDPYLKERTVERIGKGAQIVLLLDRSASMNENFAGRYFGGEAKESKVAIARKLLSEFVEKRQDDFFGMISFSTAPIHVLPLTQDKTAILSAIRATRSRGRGVTNIAPGLSMALDYFQDKPVTGSRVILLVSDGAARIDKDTQSTLAQLFFQNKAMLYWIYLRNDRSHSLQYKPKNANESTSPEYFLHQFFLSMDIPYRAFEAENPKALEEAIKEIGKLENKPIQYSIKLARENLTGRCYIWAMIGLFFLMMIRLIEIKTERNWS